MRSTPYTPELTLCVVLILLLSGAMAWTYGGPLDANTTLLFAAGPIIGWSQSTKDGALISALWSLIPLTIFPCYLAIRAAYLNNAVFRWAYLLLASMAWLFSSYFYFIAIWI